MSSRLVKSVVISVGMHALLLIPGTGAGGLSASARADVLRGMSSVELEWVDSSKWLAEQPENRVKIFSSDTGEKKEKDLLPPTGRQPERWESDGGVSWNVRPGSILNSPPGYPWQARIMGWEGTVVLRIGVAATGSVDSVQIRQGSGFWVLDEAAAAAVRQWRFAPAVRHGKAVASAVEIPITFKLKKQEEVSQ